MCDEARCPNKARCWEAGTATFLLMGDRCTRNCRFCSVEHARGHLPAPDPEEALRVVQAAELMELDHVVLTSVTRDDLDDGGASHFAHVIRTIHERLPDVTVEALIPALTGNHLGCVLDAGVDVLAHNLEVVRRLTPLVRDRRADYDLSLSVLRQAGQMDPQVRTKSSLLLGLGETLDEVCEALDHMREASVEIVALGQYLRPTRHNIEVAQYIEPDDWNDIRTEALARGFAHVAAGPFVRTSYLAHEALSPPTPVPVPTLSYPQGLTLMERAQRELVDGKEESLIVLTHEPVITLGRMADEANVLAGAERLAREGIQVVRTTRGGEVTYHGPGQLVVYPVLDLGRRRMGTRRYVQALLGAVRRALVALGVEAVLLDDVIGVFVRSGEGPPAKVAALGVSVSRGITGHGVAVNVDVDLHAYDLIVPCGLSQVGVASLHQLIRPPPTVEQTAEKLVQELRVTFGPHLRILP